MPACNATYKNSIRFTNFKTKDSGSFEYPFQRGFDYTGKGDGLQLDAWMEIKAIDPSFDIPFAEFYATSNTLLAKYNKQTKNSDDKLRLFSHDTDTAYHLDAELFGQYLRDTIALPNGVIHIVEDVVGEIRDDTFGAKDRTYVPAIFTDKGTSIEADLFIDCTGFKSRLLGNIAGSQLIPFKNLANDSAWAARIPYGPDKESEMENVTDCTAIENGWVWNIPLWNRIGTGYVYSSRFIDSEGAKEQFLNHLAQKYGADRIEGVQPFQINIKHGRRRRAWISNIVGIGLSYGFVEPLESTGLLTTHENIIRLSEVLNRRKGWVTRSEIETYNYAAEREVCGFADFVAMHYAYSMRDDTAYWKWCTEINEYDMDMIDCIVRDNRVHATIADSFATGTNLPDLGGVNYILGGLDVKATTLPEVSRMKRHGTYMTDEYYYEIRDNFMKEYNQVVEYVKGLPSNYQYLLENIYGGVDKYVESI